MKYEALYRLTTEQGGATVRLKDYPDQIVMPQKGFAVGDGAIGIVFGSTGIPEVDEGNFDRAIDRALSNFPGQGYDHFGTWIDGEMLYIDPVNVFASKEFALGVAFERGEQAIFDLTAKRTIQIRRPKNNE